MPYRYPQYATNGEHEIFESPRPEPGTSWESVATSWPRSAMSTTTVEQLQRKAKLNAAQAEAKAQTCLNEFQLEDMGDFSSATDAQPRMMDFFAGRTYQQGRAAYNQYRVSRGLPPLREGQR